MSTENRNDPVGQRPAPAVYYVPEAYKTATPTLMGRNAAGEAFMHAWLRYGSPDVFRARVEAASHAQDFEKVVRAHRPEAATECITPNRLGRLNQSGLLYYPGPDIAASAWQRTWSGATEWSLCGVTHTTASHAAMDAITGWLTAPVEPWDAVVCTSSVVAETVKVVLQAEAHRLEQRLGARRVTLPLLPVIPLGVHCDQYAFTEQQRAAARAALGLDEQSVAVLYVGRLSFHAKAHPLPMYQAIQVARQLVGAAAPRIVLIECGWYANEHIEKAFAEAVELSLEGVEHRYIDGREAAGRAQAWAAADIFCSLSDNIQETFGLTPVEAMAAGLPSVVSDWNGYKDTVRHGVDGLRVPTWMPAPGEGVEFATNQAIGTLNYDHYCGHASATVAVDIAACAQAFAALISNPGLRGQLGAQARERARSSYSWEVVYRQYEALWTEQAQRRQHAARQVEASGATRPVHPYPARMEPYTAFASYPTHTVGADTRVHPGRRTLDEAQSVLRQIVGLKMVKPFTGGDAGLSQAEQVLAAVHAGASNVAAVVQAMQRNSSAATTAAVHRRIAWLAKFGLLSLQLPRASEPKASK